MPPFNTAIVRGYDALTGSKVKLGSWKEYLAMRSGVLRINAEHRSRLSNDLGAVAGLLFDLGAGRYSAPPRADDAVAVAAWRADLTRIKEESAAAQKAMRKAREGDRTHTEVQGWLRDLGLALGFSVWVASNDRGRTYGDGRLGDCCISELPPSLTANEALDAIRLIDVLWLDRRESRISAAFEVEHTTSIYSGIVRLLDLALGVPDHSVRGLFLVAPDDREDDVRTQIRRPAFRHVADLQVRFLPYSELERHRESMSRFGEGLKAIQAVARPVC